jgi:hypothetical protein
MGERWKQERAQNFEQQQCRSYEKELKSSNLYSRDRDVLKRSFACEGSAPAYGYVDQVVRLQPTGDGGVLVLHGNAEIGRFADAETARAVEAISSEPHCPGFALGEVTDASSIVGEFHVRMIDHSEDEK